MKHVRFPVELFVPETSRLSFNEYGASIEIPLKPFNLPYHDEVETEFRLDCITLPSQDAKILSGQTFEYPKNPEDGYINGSIYIGHRHHPVDVVKIDFGLIEQDLITLQLEIEIAFTFEGLAANNKNEYGNASWRFETDIAFPTT